MTDPRDLAEDIDAISRDMPQETSGFAELRRLIGLLPNPLAPMIPGSSATELGDPGEEIGSGSLQSPVSNVLSGQPPGSQPGTDESLSSQVLIDYFGDSSTSPKGIQSAWLRLIASGVYNGDFAIGATGLIATAPTEVAGAATTADYFASLSKELPYWVVAENAGVFQRIVDPLASASSAVQMTWDAASPRSIRFYQDVPVTPGRLYTLKFNWKFADPGGIVQETLWTSFRDQTHALIGIRSGGGGPIGPLTVGTYFESIQAGTAVAPANAAFLRVEFEFSGGNNTAGTSVTISDVKVTDKFALSAQIGVSTSTPGAGVWAKTAGLAFIIVECWGGGGAGGGSGAAAAGTASMGGSGGAGGYSRRIILAADLAATENYSIGAGGTPGAAGAAGGNGGTTTFGTVLKVQATGGVGGFAGPVGAATAIGAGGTGGAGSLGSFNVNGGAGSNGVVVGGFCISTGNPGAAHGMPANRNVAGFGSSAGTNAGALTASGGGGSLTAAGGAAQVGGSGGDGRILVTEVYGT